MATYSSTDNPFGVNSSRDSVIRYTDDSGTTLYVKNTSNVPSGKGYAFTYYNTGYPTYITDNIESSSELDKMINSFTQYNVTKTGKNDINLKIGFRQRYYKSKNGGSMQLQFQDTTVLFVIVNDSNICNCGGHFVVDSFIRYLVTPNKIPNFSTYFPVYYSYVTNANTSLDECYDNTTTNYNCNITSYYGRDITSTNDYKTFHKTMIDKINSVFTYANIESFIMYNSYKNGAGPTFRDAFRFSIAKYIAYMKLPNTKTYKNSTWSTSKTWYIKVTFSTNKTSNTYNGSNVVNYETMIQKHKILYKGITKEFIISVPIGTDYLLILE